MSPACIEIVGESDPAPLATATAPLPAKAFRAAMVLMFIPAASSKDFGGVTAVAISMWLWRSDRGYELTFPRTGLRMD